MEAGKFNYTKTMSHTITCKTAFTDPEAIARTCREMGIPFHEAHGGSARLYDGTKVENALCVELPGWRHPVLINQQTGVASYDNYGGSWGEQKHLDKFTQLYDTNAATLAAEALGYQVEREYLANGYIQLAVTGYH